MKIAVIGPGAVGSVISHCLKKHDVTLLGRQELSVTINIDEQSEFLHVSSLMLSKETFDLIFVCVKANKTAEIMPYLEEMRHDKTIIIFCQNGMGQLTEINLPHSYQAVVYISGQKKNDTITHFQDKKLIVPGVPDMQNVASYLKDTPLQIIPDPHFEQQLWYKLLVNLGINTVTALSNNTAQIMSLPSIRQLVTALLTEGVSVANAHGQSFNEETIKSIIDIYDTYAPEMGTSMYYDVMNEVSTEYKYIQHAVQIAAREKNIAVPTIDVCTALLEAYEVGKN